MIQMNMLSITTPVTVVVHTDMNMRVGKVPLAEGLRIGRLLGEGGSEKARTESKRPCWTPHTVSTAAGS